MKPVFQTELSPPDGNCFEACVASILEIPLDEVPNYPPGPGWFDRFRKWLNGRNLTAYCFQASREPDGWRPQGYAILGVKPYADAPYGHEVVTFDGRIVHDPWPESVDTDSYLWEEWTVFGVLNPASLKESG